MLSDFKRLIEQSTVNYKGCVIWKHGKDFKYGKLVGTLEQCQQRIDKAIKSLGKSIV